MIYLHAVNSNINDDELRNVSATLAVYYKSSIKLKFGNKMIGRFGRAY